MDYFKLRSGYLVTPLLLIANCLVFIALVAVSQSFSQFHPMTLLKFGANYSGLVEQGQTWRLLSSVFLHLSVTHLLFNSVSLVILGRFIEPLLGTSAFLAVYIAAGIVGSAASYLFNPGVLSAGASGAIFGLFGVFIAILLGKMIRPDVRNAWAKNIATILILNLGMGFFLPVDNAAHIGGLTTGIVLGLCLVPLMKKRLLRHLL
jgi:rhomboid protease GluP